MSLQLDFQVNVFACVWIFASNLFGLSVSQISNRTNWRSFNLGSIHNISAIGVSVSNSYVWALDALGKAHIKYENGNQWAHLNDVDGTSLKLISVGEAGVWGVTKFYREIVYRYGITRILPEGNSWRKIEGQGFRQVESGPGIVYGIAQDGSLFYLVDFSPEFPHDATWRWIYGKYKYISAGMYGVWAIGADSKVYFSRITNNKPSKISKWIFVPSSVTFKKIVAGFGSTVLGLTIDGELYQMSNVNIVQPQGTNGWNRVSKLKFTDVTAGLPGIFGITVGGRTVMRQGKTTFHL